MAGSKYTTAFASFGRNAGSPTPSATPAGILSIERRSSPPCIVGVHAAAGAAIAALSARSALHLIPNVPSGDLRRGELQWAAGA